MKAELQHKEPQKADPIQSKRERSKLSFIDNRPQTVSQTKLIQSIQKKENKTGLPDNLKTGMENLSGFSMDDVRVHYNSSKPAQLNALAYAQGTDIHVAPGQEKHLPHEAWHVVQQKQGRVQPTMQMQGVSVNDNEGLEREADVVGEKVARMKSTNEYNIQNCRYEKNSTGIEKTFQLRYRGNADHNVLFASGGDYAVYTNGADSVGDVLLTNNNAGLDMTILNLPFFVNTGTIRMTKQGMVSNHENATRWSVWSPVARHMLSLFVPPTFVFPIGGVAPILVHGFFFYAHMNGPEDCVCYARGVITNDFLWGIAFLGDLQRIVAAIHYPWMNIPLVSPPVYVEINGLGNGLLQHFDYSSAQVDLAMDKTHKANVGQGIYIVRTGYAGPIGAAPGVTFHGEAVVGEGANNNLVTTKTTAGKGRIQPEFEIYGVYNNTSFKGSHGGDLAVPGMGFTPVSEGIIQQ